MKCEQCHRDTYIIHINAEHKKICETCHQEDVKNSGMSSGIKRMNSRNQ